MACERGPIVGESSSDINRASRSQSQSQSWSHEKSTARIGELMNLEAVMELGLAGAALRSWSIKFPVACFIRFN